MHQRKIMDQLDRHRPWQRASPIPTCRGCTEQHQQRSDALAACLRAGALSLPAHMVGHHRYHILQSGLAGLDDRLL